MDLNINLLLKKEKKITSLKIHGNIIAAEAAKIALKLINKNTLYKATVVLSGIPDEPSISIEPNPQVKRVKVKKRAGSKFKEFKKNYIKSKDKIEKNIETICDELKNPTSTKKTEIVVSTIPKIEIAGNGRCLDRSIAYQILAKENPSIETNNVAINNLADELRGQAANKIQNDRNCPQEFFDLHLIPSIKAIPAFSDEKRYTNKDEKPLKKSQKIQS